MKKNILSLLVAISSLQLISAQALSSAPTITFVNNTGIGTDNIASDGDGGSSNITDFDIQIYNISNVSGTFTTPLSWENSTFFTTVSFNGITANVGTGTKGMVIKSVSGAEFKLYQFDYLNWGETASAINTVKGYRNGNEVVSTTFEGFSSPYAKKTITLTTGFENVDEVRFYISSGGYQGSQSYTNHSLNAVKVGSPVITLATNDFVAVEKYKIYPVETTNSVTVETESVQNSLLHVYDITGKLMFKEDLEGKINNINVKQLPAGLYFFNIISSEGTITQKIIKK